MATVAPASTSKLTSARIINGNDPLCTCLESLRARMTVEGIGEVWTDKAKVGPPTRIANLA
jgi:hypothetical protein